MTLARMFQALADGVQLQWMLDPSIDMADVVGALFDLARADGSDAGPGADPTPSV